MKEVSNCCRATVICEISLSWLWPYVLTTICSACSRKCKVIEIEKDA